MHAEIYTREALVDIISYIIHLECLLRDLLVLDRRFDCFRTRYADRSCTTALSCINPDSFPPLPMTDYIVLSTFLDL